MSTSKLLEQMVRMRELLNMKEAGLTEVKSKLTFAREVASAREGAKATRREAETAREEVEEVTCMLVVECENRTISLEGELDKLREMESLRREFDAERRQLRQD